MKLFSFITKKKKIFILLIVLIVLIALIRLSLKSYVACGCGSCGGSSVVIGFTMNPKEIISNDQRLKNSGQCDQMGCGICTEYYYFKFTE